MTPWPARTVSLLFSDIEGSTALLRRLGSAYGDALVLHRRILREVWRTGGGTELTTEGDSFFVVFDNAPDAVTAACDAQRRLVTQEWPGGEVLRVRIGIHTGSPASRDGGYVGLDVHRAARIAGAAHGGQVLVSASTAELVSGHLPAGVVLRDLGTHRLRDLPLPEHLFQAEGADLPGPFPPVRSVGSASSLPRAATPTVGRRRELKELTELLTARESALLTLVGPGGSGKTRLAVELARTSLDVFPDGVYFVALAEVTQVHAMWAAIAETLSLTADDRSSRAVVGYLQHRSVLLVLDNLEQLTGADVVVAHLLEQVPHLSVVATSRSPLHLSTETEYALCPLELPVTDGLDEVAQSDAVRLFTQQARRVRTGFALTPDNAAEVAAVCRRLDGLPLAIELAAARSKLLSPRALLRQLEAGFQPAALASDGSSRHRTLRATVGWSYDLLSPAQRAFFRQMAVFAGGADLGAISAVVLAGPAYGSPDALDMVAELVDASLLTVTETTDGEPRVAMLGTVRAVALELLSASGEAEAVRERHARFYLDLVERMSRELSTERRLDSRLRLSLEQDNLSAALDWALGAESGGASGVETGLALCKGLVELWAATGAVTEWRRRLTQLVDRLGGVTGANDPGLAWSLQFASAALRATGDLEGAKQYAAASVEMWRRLDRPGELARALHTLAAMHLHVDELASAEALLDEAFQLAGSSGDEEYLLVALSDYALLRYAQQDFSGSLELNGRLLELAEKQGNLEYARLARHNSAESLYRLGRFDEARAAVLSLIPGELELEEPTSLAALGETLAQVLVEVGEHREAVRLLASTDRLRHRLGAPRLPMQEDELAEVRARARAALTDADWDSAYRSGAAARLEDLLAPGAPSRPT